MKSEHIIILGNSAAAIAAINAIRAHRSDAAITLVSAEDCAAYSPVLTTHYLSGEMSESELYFCDAGYYRDRRVACHFGDPAVELDTVARRVLLASGKRLDYDKLLIATGAAAKKITGLDPAIAGDIRYLRTIEDARRIHDGALRARHIVVMGGGLVSMQTAAAVARPDLRVTCVVASRQILSRNMDAVCAELVRRHVERSAAIEFRFGASVAAIERAGGGYRVLLDSGDELAADMVVAGKGVSPNVAFVDRSRVTVGRGVVADDHLRTSADGVWAAGDVAEARNRVTGEPDVVTNWIDASEQGAAAGADMAGADVAFAGSVPANITTLFGLSVASVGISTTRPGDGLREVTHLDEQHGVYRKLVLRDDVLVGGTLLRDCDDAGELRAAVAAGWEPWPSAEAVAKGHLRFSARVKWGLLHSAQGKRAMVQAGAGGDA